MSKMLRYKNYYGSVEFSLDDMVLHGKVECIADVVTYEGETLPQLQKAFEEAVEDYLETCREIGKSPDKPMSGTFNVRIGSDLHKKAYVSARNQGVNLNEYIKKAVEEKVANRSEIHLHFDRKAERTLEKIDYSKNSFQSGNWQLAVEGRLRH